MYCIEVTTHNVVTDTDTTVCLYNVGLWRAVEVAYVAEACLGVDGFVSVKYQSSDSSGFVVLDRLDWEAYWAEPVHGLENITRIYGA